MFFCFLICTLFDQLLFFLLFYAFLLHFLVILCECGFAFVLLFYESLRLISELGCKVHHKSKFVLHQER